MLLVVVSFCCDSKLFLSKHWFGSDPTRYLKKSFPTLCVSYFWSYFATFNLHAVLEIQSGKSWQGHFVQYISFYRALSSPLQGLESSPATESVVGVKTRSLSVDRKHSTWRLCQSFEAYTICTNNIWKIPILAISAEQDWHSFGLCLNMNDKKNSKCKSILFKTSKKFTPLSVFM